MGSLILVRVVSIAGSRKTGQSTEISMHMTEYISAAPALHMVAYGGNEAL
jgi:hypothetical protein